jgi:hypothetical protein
MLQRPCCSGVVEKCFSQGMLFLTCILPSWYFRFNRLCVLKQGLSEGEGGKEGDFPGPPVKGGGGDLQKGGTKGVIKKHLFGTFFYINNGMKKIFRL